MPSLVLGVFLGASWLVPLLPRPVLLQGLLGAAAALFLTLRLARTDGSFAVIGLRLDNLLPSTAVFLTATALLAAPALCIGEPVSIAPDEIFRYFFWALFQQFLVVAGFWRNLRENAWLTALAFSIAHAPNVPLMALVFAAETVWLLLFARFRNLASLALAHAGGALVASHALVPVYLPSLRVGLVYWTR